MGHFSVICPGSGGPPGSGPVGASRKKSGPAHPYIKVIQAHGKASGKQINIVLCMESVENQYHGRAPYYHG